MDRLTELMELIKEEFGIETPEQLFEAVRRIDRIDITPLCAESRNTVKELIRV